MRSALVLALAILSAPAASAQEGESLPLTWENIFTRSTGVRQAALSPDGSQVAVTATTTGSSGIFLIGTDGGIPILLVEGGSSPVWMPNGRELVFSAQGDLWSIDGGPRFAAPARIGTSRSRADYP
jgi:Tol biopolymer transport system component